MYVNNEIGVTQPVKEIGEICRQNKIFFHTDAAQVEVRGRFRYRNVASLHCSQPLYFNQRQCLPIRKIVLLKESMSLDMFSHIPILLSGCW